MSEENISLEERFGYVKDYTQKERKGYLLNYRIDQFPDTSLHTIYHFIDDSNESLSVSVPYFPSVLLKSKDTNHTEE
jgi:hypothetical protein